MNAMIKDELRYWGQTFLHRSAWVWDWVLYALLWLWSWIEVGALTAWDWIVYGALRTWDAAHLGWLSLRAFPGTVRRAIRGRLCWMLKHDWEHFPRARNDGSDDWLCHKCSRWKTGRSDS